MTAGRVRGVLSAPLPSAWFARRARAGQRSRHGRGSLSGSAQARRAKAFPKLVRKFAREPRLDPGIVTLLTWPLATSSKAMTQRQWIEFTQDLEWRNASRGRRATVRRGHLAALTSRLPKITIIVPRESESPGLEVSLDGERSGKPALGSRLAIDRAPTHRCRRHRQKRLDHADSRSPPEQKTVTVPALDPTPKAPTPRPFRQLFPTIAHRRTRRRRKPVRAPSALLPRSQRGARGPIARGQTRERSTAWRRAPGYREQRSSYECRQRRIGWRLRGWGLGRERSRSLLGGAERVCVVQRFCGGGGIDDWVPGSIGETRPSRRLPSVSPSRLHFEPGRLAFLRHD